MPRRSRPLWLLLAPALLAGLAGCDDGPTEPPGDEPTETPTDDGAPAERPTDVDETAFEADFDIDEDCFGIAPVDLEPDAVTCGTVEVPADHDEPGGPTLHLAVAAFTGSDRDAYGAPLLLLGGGPGQVMVEPHLTRPPLRTLSHIGPDLIVVDQRGVGASDPALECPQLPEVETQDTVAEDVDVALGALADCRERLVDDGVDLDAFDHLANARDVDLVRRALGQEQLNLRGGSYGSQVALLAAEMFPDRVRSVTLSSPLDPSSNWVEGTAAGLERSLGAVADLCAEDEACDDAVGDLHAAIAETVDRLAGQAEEVTVQPPGGDEVTRTYTPEQYVGGLFLLFYDAQLTQLLPAIVDRARAGDLEPLAWVVAVLDRELEDMVSAGMHYSMVCSGEGGRFSPERALAGVDGELVERYWFPSAVIGGEPTPSACDVWDVAAAYDPDDIELGAEVPTLVVTGGLDHVTPPELGERVHEALPNSHLVEVPGAAHSPLESISVEPCGRELQQSFLRDPGTAPDDACAREVEPQLRTTLPPGFG